MNKKMAVAAQPHKIFQYVVFPVSVYVMDNDHFFVLCLTQSADLWNLASPHSILVGIFPMFPVRMFVADKIGVPPQNTAHKTAKKFSTFCLFYAFKRLIRLFLATCTAYHLPISPPFVSARARTIFTSATFHKKWFCLEPSATCPANFNERHTHILPHSS